MLDFYFQVTGNGRHVSEKVVPNFTSAFAVVCALADEAWGTNIYVDGSTSPHILEHPCHLPTFNDWYQVDFAACSISLSSLFSVRTSSGSHTNSPVLTSTVLWPSML